MRDPKRIDRIMTKLKCYWMLHPDLRLGQIVANALGDGGVFYKEDEVLELWLAKELQQGKDANNARCPRCGEAASECEDGFLCDPDVRCEKCCFFGDASHNCIRIPARYEKKSLSDNCKWFLQRTS